MSSDLVADRATLIEFMRTILAMPEVSLSAAGTVVNFLLRLLPKDKGKGKDKGEGNSRGKVKSKEDKVDSQDKVNSKVADNLPFQGNVGSQEKRQSGASLQVLRNGQPVFQLDADRVRNKMSSDEKLRLMNVLAYPHGAKVSSRHLRDSFQVVFVPGSGQPSQVLFSARPGEHVVNHLGEYEVSRELINNILPSSAVVDKKNFFSFIRDLFGGQHWEHNFSRWFRGNLFAPGRWFDGLKDTLQPVQHLFGKFHSRVLGERGIARHQVLLRNVKSLFGAFGESQLGERRLWPTAAVFAGQKPNAIWSSRALSLASGYQLHVLTSSDCPGCYQVRLLDPSQRSVLSVAWERDGRVAYVHHSVQNDFERSLVDTLFYDGLDKLLDGYRQAVPDGERSAVFWQEHPERLPQYLFQLVRVVDAQPQLANFLPPAERQMVASVYQTHLTNTLRCLQMVNGSGPVAVAHPENPSKELFFSLQTIQDDFSKNKYQELQIDECNVRDRLKTSLFRGPAEPFLVSDVSDRVCYDLASLVRLNDLLYDKLVEDLRVTAELQPGFLRRVVPQLEQYNTYQLLRSGNLGLKPEQFPFAQPPIPEPLDQPVAVSSPDVNRGTVLDEQPDQPVLANPHVNFDISSDIEDDLLDHESNSYSFEDVLSRDPFSCLSEDEMRAAFDYLANPLRGPAKSRSDLGSSISDLDFD